MKQCMTVKKALGMFGVVSALVLAGMTQPAAAQVSLKAEMLKDWSSLQATMTKIANEMPEHNFAFKPTPAQQSYGERVLHIAQVNNRFLGLVGGTAKAPTIAPNATSKAAAMKAMADSFEYGTALLNEQTDATLLQAVANPPGFLGPSTRARIFNFLVGHTWDIYGQMAVYLRLEGWVPPASQRP